MCMCAYRIACGSARGRQASRYRYRRLWGRSRGTCLLYMFLHTAVYVFCVTILTTLRPRSRSRHAIYVSSYCYMCCLILNLCPHTTRCVFSYRNKCVPLLHVCPHAIIYVLIPLYMCPHSALYVFAYFYICVLIPLYMCPHSTMSLSSYCYICVLILYTCGLIPLYVRVSSYWYLYMCPHTARSRGQCRIWRQN
jgi:hypothetical protein